MALSEIERVHVSAILDDCLDQLDILGNISSVPADTRSNATKFVKKEIADIIARQHDLEKHYEQLWTEKLELKQSVGVADKIKETEREIRQAGQDLKGHTTHMAMFFKQNPLGADVSAKMQYDRSFLENILKVLSAETRELGTFESLKMAIRHEKSKKEQLQPLIERELEQRARIKQLQRQIAQVHREKQHDIEERSQIIAHYKDQLQEVKAKTGMEQKYEKKCNDMKIGENMKRCRLSARDIQKEIDTLKLQIDQETRVNNEIANYLSEQEGVLKEKLDKWTKKRDDEVDQLSRKLNVLKMARQKNYDEFNQLSKQYTEYEAVVIDDRREKQEIRLKREKEERELNAAIVVQVWWRFMMQKHKLGPHRKKKKGKKGKKGKKK